MFYSFVYWKEVCRDPDNFNWLASYLVKRIIPNTYQEDMNSNP
jgi:hypothetical protein